MKVTAVYFSPTGNTKKSTEVMAAAVSEHYDVIDLTRYENREMKHDFGQDELVILVCLSMREGFRWLRLRD